MSVGSTFVNKKKKILIFIITLFLLYNGHIKTCGILKLLNNITPQQLIGRHRKGHDLASKKLVLQQQGGEPFYGW
jgi:hypothetical protein